MIIFLCMCMLPSNNNNAFTESAPPKLPVKLKAKEFEETIDQGIKIFEDSKKRELLLTTDLVHLKEKVQDDFELLLKQKREEIWQLGGRFMKIQEENNKETMSLSVQVAETIKLKDKLQKSTDSLQNRVNTAERDVGYD